VFTIKKPQQMQLFKINKKYTANIFYIYDDKSHKKYTSSLSYVY